jgi:hypothetical protein
MVPHCSFLLPFSCSGYRNSHCLIRNPTAQYGSELLSTQPPSSRNNSADCSRMTLSASPTMFSVGISSDEICGDQPWGRFSCRRPNALKGEIRSRPRTRRGINAGRKATRHRKNPLLLDATPSGRLVRHDSKIRCADRPARSNRPEAQQIDTDVDSPYRAEGQSMTDQWTTGI